MRTRTLDVPRAKREELLVSTRYLVDVDINIALPKDQAPKELVADLTELCKAILAFHIGVRVNISNFDSVRANIKSTRATKTNKTLRTLYSTMLDYLGYSRTERNFLIGWLRGIDHNEAMKQRGQNKNKQLSNIKYQLRLKRERLVAKPNIYEKAKLERSITKLEAKLQELQNV